MFLFSAAWIQLSHPLTAEPRRKPKIQIVSPLISWKKTLLKIIVLKQHRKSKTKSTLKVLVKWSEFETIRDKFVKKK